MASLLCTAVISGQLSLSPIWYLPGCITFLWGYWPEKPCSPLSAAFHALISCCVFLSAIQEGGHLFSLLFSHPRAALLGSSLTFLLAVCLGEMCAYLIPLLALPCLLTYLLSQPVAAPGMSAFLISLLQCLLLFPGMQKSLPSRTGKRPYVPVAILYLLLCILQRNRFLAPDGFPGLPLLRLTQQKGIYGHPISVLTLYGGVLIRSACAWRIQIALGKIAFPHRFGFPGQRTGAADRV